MKLTRRQLRKIIMEHSNLPFGTTIDHISGHHDDEDLFDLIVLDFEEQLEERAEEMGLLQTLPHKKALRLAYDSDPDYFNNLQYDALENERLDYRDFDRDDRDFDF